MEINDGALRGAFINFGRQVVTRARVDYLRHIRYLERHEVLMDDTQVSVDKTGYWLDHYASNDETLNETCKRLLTPIERQTLYQVIIMDRTTKEAAHLMHVSEQWVRQARRNALKKLKDALTREEVNL